MATVWLLMGIYFYDGHPVKFESSMTAEENCRTVLTAMLSNKTLDKGKCVKLKE